MRTDIKIKASDNALLYGYIWKNETNDPDKIVIISHGMAEHIERYDAFAENLVKAGYGVVGMNQRGHYQTSSKDDYGYMGKDVNNFDILVSDIHDVSLWVKENYSNATLYGFGHSMGSFVMNRVVEVYPDLFTKLVLSGTGKNPNLILNMGAFFASLIKLFKGEKHRSKFINGLSFGSFNKAFKPNRTEYDWLNTVDAEVDKYVDDEWCGGIFTLKYFHDFFKGCVKVTKNQKLINPEMPILLISGSCDPVGNMGKGVEQVYLKLNKLNKKVSIHLIEKERHEILLENSKDITHKFIIDFINA